MVVLLVLVFVVVFEELRRLWYLGLEKRLKVLSRI